MDTLRSIFWPSIPPKPHNWPPAVDYDRAFRAARYAGSLDRICCKAAVEKPQYTATIARWCVSLGNRDEAESVLSSGLAQARRDFAKNGASKTQDSGLLLCEIYLALLTFESCKEVFEAASPDYVSELLAVSEKISSEKSPALSLMYFIEVKRLLYISPAIDTTYGLKLAMALSVLEGNAFSHGLSVDSLDACNIWDKLQCAVRPKVADHERKFIDKIQDLHNYNVSKAMRGVEPTAASGKYAKMNLYPATYLQKALDVPEDKKNV